MSRRPAAKSTPPSPLPSTHAIDEHAVLDRGLIPPGPGHVRARATAQTHHRSFLQVFVVHNDLTRLSCDAWMLPTDDKLGVESYWNLDFPLPPRPDAWGEKMRVLKVTKFPSRWCPPWLVNVGGHNLPPCALCSVTAAVMYCPTDKVSLCGRCDEEVHKANAIAGDHQREYCADIRWYIDGARHFFHEVFKEVRLRVALNGRERPLVALPLVGTGKGGAGQATGGVAANLLPALYAAAEQFGFDIALVTNARSKFAAVQVLRQTQHVKENWNAWGHLNDELRREADELAGHARRGNLVLFLGSGISSGAGLPMWSELIEELARVAGMEEDEIVVLRSMNHLDAARIVELHLGANESLNRLVAQKVTVSVCTLASCLLAGLPVKEIVTTNYDTMYEMASRGAGLRTAVLPYSPASDCDRWVLKIHGCATHPEDIVLTREDYLRYSTRRSALQGIVQSLLITRHMLFVGFSLRDDNFHRIVDEVRRALQSSTGQGSAKVTARQPHTTHDTPDHPTRKKPASASPTRTTSNSATTESSTAGAAVPIEQTTTPNSTAFGTSLTLVRNRIADMLWRGDLNMVAMQESDEVPRSTTLTTTPTSPTTTTTTTTTAPATPLTPLHTPTRKPSSRSLIADPTPSAIASSARLLEIFLDYLLSCSTSTAAYLLQPQFDSVLSEPQRVLRTAILRFAAAVPSNARETKEWSLLENLFRAMGAEERTIRSDQHTTTPDNETESAKETEAKRWLSL